MLLVPVFLLDACRLIRCMRCGRRRYQLGIVEFRYSAVQVFTCATLWPDPHERTDRLFDPKVSVEHVRAIALAYAAPFTCCSSRCVWRRGIGCCPTIF